MSGFSDSSAERRQPTAAVLTPRGRGAIAAVRLVGSPELLDQPPALFRAASGRPVAQLTLNQICFGRWGDEPGEEVLVCRTGPLETEIFCHGGEASVRQVLADLQSRGVRVVPWQQMLAEHTDWLTAECWQALSRASTLRTAGVLLEQASGQLRQTLLELLELAEPLGGRPDAGGSGHTQWGRLDPTKRTDRAFRESEVAEWPAAEREEAQRRLRELLRWSDFGLHLTEPWRVVLAGRPNVGKSSLINALLGYTRAIVCDQPGTTRDVVSADTAFDGWPVRLCDTAGVRQTDEALERAGVERARQLLQQADCRLLLVDVSQPPTDEDRRLLETWPDSVVVAHKADLPSRWPRLPEGAVRVSSRTGEGLSELVRAVVARVVPTVPPSGTAVPVCARQVQLLRAALAATERGDRRSYRAALRECLRGPEPSVAETSGLLDG